MLAFETRVDNVSVHSHFSHNGLVDQCDFTACLVRADRPWAAGLLIRIAVSHISRDVDPILESHILIGVHIAIDVAEAAN